MKVMLFFFVIGITIVIVWLLFIKNLQARVESNERIKRRAEEMIRDEYYREITNMPPLYYVICREAVVGKEIVVTTELPYEDSLKYAKSTGRYEHDKNLVRFKVYIEDIPFVIVIFELNNKGTGLIIEDEESYYKDIEDECTKIARESGYSKEEEENLRRLTREQRKF